MIEVVNECATVETITNIIYNTKKDEPCYYKEEKKPWYIAGFVGEWLILGSEEVDRGCIKSFTSHTCYNENYNSYRFASPIDIHFEILAQDSI